MAQSIILEIEHIARTPGICGGRPHIAGRRIPVSHIAHAFTVRGESLDAIMRAFDLTAAQVHAALAYYYDHREDIEAEIAEEGAALARVEQSRWAIGTSEQDALRAAWQEKQPLLAGNPDQELTATEIAEGLGITARAVRKACETGRISARKSGAVWLIRRGDARAYWGDKK